MIIFDCNGVLVDSEPIAAAVAAEAFQKVGINMTAEMVARYFTGRRPADMFVAVEEAAGVRLPANFATQVSSATLVRLHQEVRALAHVEQALSWLRGPKAVASSSSLDRVRICLNATELSRFFGHNLFSAVDVPEGKPAPDLFLHVAQQTGVQPQDCIVVEDSPAGVTAAVAAGMTAIGFVGGSHAGEDMPGKLQQAGAVAVIADMRALKPEVTRLRGY
ncbi:HAD family phosphatase [Pseudorhodoplanes sp.]|jgi:HAD superfamily hydrolase (TIGR01509 family)|uniref:HAD family hydrolase n=1 Tax=Pseudorhodoplanes sp. TaxID=1934341 RepID=UPI002C065BB6|nr:HAD family phosphatase [Pseudorhodoplanes sp.]HWV42228.1 HAD family phosphatase [Pseudorhodoplanes sp.]